MLLRRKFNLPPPNKKHQPNNKNKKQNKKPATNMSCSYLCLIMYILNMFQDIIIFNDNLTWSDHINDICKNVISVLICLFECDIYFLKEKTLSDYAVIVLIFI